ncbi:N/A [soil metagenome]
MTTDTLYRRFRTVVDAHPGLPALTDSEGTLTYRQLDDAATTFATWLGDREVAAGAVVGVAVDRSAASVTAIVGCIAAGCAYVAYDPNWPTDRLAHVLRDSGAALDVRFGHGSVLESPCDLLSRPGLAYVVYTSGTTGEPKGVPITHRNVLTMLDAALPLFDLSPGDGWSLFHSLTFDFSVWELWGALLTGGHVIVVDRRSAANPSSFSNFLSDHRIRVLSQVPSVFAVGVEEHVAALRSNAYNLRYLVFGGEALQPEIAERVLANSAAVRIVNMYGITEATVHATFAQLDRAQIRHAIVTGETPIGRPLESHFARIREPEVAADASSTGELLLAGDAVTGGYLNSPGLNAQRFELLDGRRYFRTGDRVRMLTDGSMTFLHRIGSQLKVLGYRIEATEVEAAVRRVTGASGCAVVVVGDPHPRLVALIVCDQVLDSAALRAALVAHLPAYMIPHQIYRVPGLPLTSNGKVDRNAATLTASRLSSADR